MSEEKTKSPEVKALENEVAGLKEKLEKLSALPELLETEKHLRSETEKELEIAQDKINSFLKWGEEFERFSDSEYKGSFIAVEIKKILNKEKKNGNKSTS